LQADNKDHKDPIMPYGIRKVQLYNIRKKVGKAYNLEDPIWEAEKWCIFSKSEAAQWHHHRGCAEPLKQWVNSSGDALFVIGFCVIAFLKVTFLGILHYEIKEMIKKIRFIQRESQQMNGDLADALGLGGVTCSPNSSSCSPINSPPPKQQQQDQLVNNGPVIQPVDKPVRPTELVPVNTLVTNFGGHTTSSVVTGSVLCETTTTDCHHHNVNNQLTTTKNQQQLTNVNNQLTTTSTNVNKQLTSTTTNVNNQLKMDQMLAHGTGSSNNYGSRQTAI
jgi:hypothetical protein